MGGVEGFLASILPWMNIGQGRERVNAQNPQPVQRPQGEGGMPGMFPQGAEDAAWMENIRETLARFGLFTGAGDDVEQGQDDQDQLQEGE